MVSFLVIIMLLIWERMKVVNSEESDHMLYTGVGVGTIKAWINGQTQYTFDNYVLLWNYNRLQMFIILSSSYELWEQIHTNAITK